MVRLSPQGGARALIRKGFTELGVRRVFAETMAVNLASRRVMEKSGLEYVRTFYEDFSDPIAGAEHGEVEYALTRSAWERNEAEGRPWIPARNGTVYSPE